MQRNTHTHTLGPKIDRIQSTKRGPIRCNRIFILVQLCVPGPFLQHARDAKLEAGLPFAGCRSDRTFVWAPSSRAKHTHWAMLIFAYTGDKVRVHFANINECRGRMRVAFPSHFFVVVAFSLSFVRPVINDAEKIIPLSTRIIRATVGRAMMFAMRWTNEFRFI